MYPNYVDLSINICIQVKVSQYNLFVYSYDLEIIFVNTKYAFFQIKSGDHNEIQALQCKVKQLTAEIESARRSGQCHVDFLNEVSVR